jgi:protocatechuate 3,4-dioxygenase beta subunit
MLWSRTLDLGVADQNAGDAVTTRRSLRAFGRREAFEALAATVGIAWTAACGESPSTTATEVPATTSGAAGAAAGSCVVAAEETAGPYPDRLGMLANKAFFRRDIREGRSGALLNLTLTITNARTNCSPVANASVEIWQCDASGNYSEYAQPGYNGTGQTFLRGLQTTDANGTVTFTTVYPGWYAGRATHIHVKVYVNGAVVKTTQVAFPESITAEVYASGVYASKGQSPTKNASDNVFADGTTTEMASVSGSAEGGFDASLTIGISV